ncbi:MAG: tol-pal system-associated acyl-CoA thioesterase [Micavibrio sp.]|nr:MAG: tol-pal system-associated acyl-CoA thioesterase [Micavibrio sp.]
MTQHRLDIRIYYGDTDAGGVVYHAAYLRLAEQARTEMLRDIGFAHAEFLKETGIAFAVRHMEIDFRRPAVLDDALTIATRVTHMGNARLDMEQQFEKNGEAIVGIKLTLVCMDVKTQKAARLPEECRAVLQKMM